MTQEDWITIIPAVAGYLIWPAYRLITGNRKSLTASTLKVVFLLDVGLSMFLVLDMRDMQRRHVIDGGDTIFVIIFIALLSFAVSAMTIAASFFAGIIKKYSKAF